MPGHSRSKNGVASLAYVPGIHDLARKKDVDGRDEPGHDDQENNMSDEILSQQDGPILRITFNRPDHGNGATDYMATELKRLLDTAHEKSRLVVLRGAG